MDELDRPVPNPGPGERADGLDRPALTGKVQLPVGAAHRRMGLSEAAPGLFVVAFDSVVAFRRRPDGPLGCVAHRYTRDDPDPDARHAPQTDGAVTHVALPGKGACHVGIVAGGEYLLAWHLGPRNDADPTTARWLEVVQEAQHDPVAETRRHLCELATWAPEPQAEATASALAGALAGALRAPAPWYLCCEDRPVTAGYGTFDPRRFRQAEPYRGNVVQPLLVRWIEPRPHDCLDVWVNPEAQTPWPAVPEIWVRTASPDGPVGTPMAPSTPVEWYRITPAHLNLQEAHAH